MKSKYSINACRLCLENDSVQSIYDKDECDLSIYEKIMHCTNIQINTDINWPDKICELCLQSLDAAYKFIIMCNHSDDILLQLYAENEIQLICEDDEDVKSATSHIKAEDDIVNIREVEIQKLDEISVNCVAELEEGHLEKSEDEDLENNCILKQSDSIKIFTSKKKNKKDRDKSDVKSMHICEVCGNIYQYKSVLETHMRRHTNEKPFACEICNRRFTLNGQLTCHMRTHTGEKPYECQFCKRKFADVGARQVHERIHTGERPFKCDICNKSFTYASVLKKHSLTHTDEKKHSCEYCGKKFRLRYHLTAHLKTSKHQSSKKGQEYKINLDPE